MRRNVVNQTGAPLEGASVMLISRAYPYGFEKSRDTKRTDAARDARFDDHRQWRVELFLFIHGAESYFWNWCVEKDGYQTFRTHWTSDDEFNARPTIALQPGQAISCEHSER